MVLLSSNPWELTDQNALVSIGTHSLHISTSGPPRRHPNSPVLLFFSGGGAPCAIYKRLQNLLSRHHRVYFVDRAGYDTSGVGSYEVYTAQLNAHELKEVLGKIGVAPPYVLMAHSYGGIVARAFLQMYLDEGVRDAVVGLVLADTANELFYQVFEHSPDPALVAVAKGVELEELLHFRERSGLTDREWEDAMEAAERTQKRSVGEDTHGSGLELARAMQIRRKVMGTWPVSVVRCNLAVDFWMLYHAGVEREQGSAEERERARKYIERVELFEEDVVKWQVGLSGQGGVCRYSSFEEKGHEDIMLRPEVYCEEVCWVMEKARRMVEKVA